MNIPIVGIVDDTRCELHTQSPGHPECPERVIAVRRRLKDSGLYDELRFIPARIATELELQMVHSTDYVQHVKNTCLNNGIGFGRFISQDPDMFVAHGEQSYISALVAAGSVIEATKHVLYGNCNHVYCNVRPPGHHAYKSKGGGFCIFNNVALGVKEAMKCPKVNRVLIFDWDLHHGDGTADIFKDDPYVLFISTHRSAPFYPGTGNTEDNTSSVLNFPLEKGYPAENYQKLFNEKIFPQIADFDPDLIFISCGIDAHEDDPMAELMLTEKDYQYMTYKLKILKKPIVCVLEGGYNVEAVANSVHAIIQTLLI